MYIYNLYPLPQKIHSRGLLKKLESKILSESGDGWEECLKIFFFTWIPSETFSLSGTEGQEKLYRINIKKGYQGTIYIYLSSPNFGNVYLRPFVVIFFVFVVEKEKKEKKAMYLAMCVPD